MKASNTVYTSESELLNKVIEWIEPQKRNGIVVLKIRDRYTSGYSDLFINARGRFVVAELKDNEGTPTRQQLDFIKSMKKAGGTGGVCRSVLDVSKLIDEALYCVCESTGNDKYCSICGKEIK